MTPSPIPDYERLKSLQYALRMCGLKLPEIEQDLTAMIERQKRLIEMSGKYFAAINSVEFSPEQLEAERLFIDSIQAIMFS